MEKAKDLFFVGIEEPADVRKNVLESQKIIVESLQRHENIKFLRVKRLENINKLKRVIRELLKLISDLKIVLPPTKTEEAEVKKKLKTVRKVVKKKKEKKEIKKEVKKSVSELEKLESELGAIENKLSSLK